MAPAAVLRSTLRRATQSTPVRAWSKTVGTRSCSRIIRPSQARPFSTRKSLFVKKYTTDHEWVELSSDGDSATIGISTYAADALGEVVYVELPTPDEEFTAGDTIGAVESVKSASDILAPVSGTVIESNSLLEDTPGHINKSPEGEAWIAKVKISSAGELDTLMDADAYKAFTEEVGTSGDSKE